MHALFGHKNSSNSASTAASTTSYDDTTSTTAALQQSAMPSATPFDPAVTTVASPKHSTADDLVARTTTTTTTTDVDSADALAPALEATSIQSPALSTTTTSAIAADAALASAYETTSVQSPALSTSASTTTVTNAATVAPADGETEMIRMAHIVLDEEGNPVVTEETYEETAYFRERYYEDVTSSEYADATATGLNNAETVTTTTTTTEEVDRTAAPTSPLEPFNTNDMMGTSTMLRSPSIAGSTVASTYGTPIMSNTNNTYAAPAVVSETIEQTETIRPAVDTTTTYIEEDQYLSSQPRGTTNNMIADADTTASMHGSVMDDAAALATTAPLADEAFVVDNTMAPAPATMTDLPDMPPADRLSMDAAAVDAPLEAETTASRRINKRLVVIAVDDSTASTHAINWALKQLLHPTRDHLVIFTVAAYKTHGLLGHANPEKSVRREQKAEVAAQRVLDYCNKVVVEWQAAQQADISYEMVSMKSADNRVRDVIVDYVRDVNADLLVMGAHAGGALKRAVAGSTSTYCLHHATIPVVIVKEDGAVSAV
ncbi:hypothetical protein RI367_002930 [Sorochytrium milnesiophthora]